MTVLAIKKKCSSIRTSVRSLAQSSPRWSLYRSAVRLNWSLFACLPGPEVVHPFRDCVTSLFHILNLFTECCKDSKYWSLGMGSDGPQIWSNASFQIKLNNGKSQQHLSKEQQIRTFSTTCPTFTCYARCAVHVLWCHTFSSSSLQAPTALMSLTRELDSQLTKI